MTVMQIPLKTMSVLLIMVDILKKEVQENNSGMLIIQYSTRRTEALPSPPAPQNEPQPCCLHASDNYILSLISKADFEGFFQEA